MNNNDPEMQRLLYEEAQIEHEKNELGRALLEELKADRSSVGVNALRERFGYHKATETTAPMHQAVRGLMLDVATVLDRMLPNGRAKFQAIVQLEESCMWANKAIAEMAPVVDE